MLHFIVSPPNEQREGWGGGCAAGLTIYVLFFLFSRPREGLVTTLSSFFGLAANSLNVRNNNIRFVAPHGGVSISSVQYNGGLLPDILLLTQGYYRRGTRLNTM